MLWPPRSQRTRLSIAIPASVRRCSHARKSSAANGKRKMERAASAMRRDRRRRRITTELESSTAPEQQQHAAPRRRQTRKNARRTPCGGSRTTPRRNARPQRRLRRVGTFPALRSRAAQRPSSPYSLKILPLESIFDQPLDGQTRRDGGAPAPPSSRSTYLARISTSRLTASPVTSARRFVFA